MNVLKMAMALWLKIVAVCRAARAKWFPLPMVNSSGGKYVQRLLFKAIKHQRGMIISFDHGGYPIGTWKDFGKDDGVVTIIPRQSCNYEPDSRSRRGATTDPWIAELAKPDVG